MAQPWFHPRDRPQNYYPNLTPNHYANHPTNRLFPSTRSPVPSPFQQTPSGPQAPPEESGKPKPMRAAGSTVLKVFPIKGDGRCMFRSIARTIAHSEKRSMTDKDETNDADYMRQACYQVICVDKRAAFEQAKVLRPPLPAGAPPGWRGR